MANLPDTVTVARMWIFAHKLMPKGKVEASAAVSDGKRTVEGRFQFVYDLETLRIDSIFVRPELTEVRDYWGMPHFTGSYSSSTLARQFIAWNLWKTVPSL